MDTYTEKCMELIDLEKNGLAERVYGDTEKYRKGKFALNVVDENGIPLAGTKIHIELKKHEFKFGSTAFLADEFKNDNPRQREYEARFSQLFNQAVLAFYWHDDEPQRGKLRFDRGSEYIYRRPPTDEALDFCRRVGAEPKGHNLLWQNPDSGIPEWWPEDKKLCKELIIERIELIARRYAAEIPVWDVTNECISAPGIEKMPKGYDTLAWQTATRLFPNNHLILNDFYYFDYAYNAEMSPVYLQAQKLLLQGARIDGIGIQYHLFNKMENLPRQAKEKGMLNGQFLLKVLDTYASLGTAQHISEITVPSYSSTPELLELQAKLTESLYRIWFSHPSVQSIVWWNLADGFAYRNQNQNEDYYGGGLLNHDFSPKPAYEVLDRLINSEWHTSLDCETDKDGNAGFNGFFGDYEIKFVDSNVRKTASFNRENQKQSIVLNK